MLLNAKTKNGNLIAKDILDFDFDLFIEPSKELPGKYTLWFNKKMRHPTDFDTKKEAEEQLMTIVDQRNSLEEQLRGFY